MLPVAVEVGGWCLRPIKAGKQTQASENDASPRLSLHGNSPELKQ
jgi:hypothetical protein